MARSRSQVRRVKGSGVKPKPLNPNTCCPDLHIKKPRARKPKRALHVGFRHSGPVADTPQPSKPPLSTPLTETYRPPYRDPCRNPLKVPTDFNLNLPVPPERCKDSFQNVTKHSTKPHKSKRNKTLGVRPKTLSAKLCT